MKLLPFLFYFSMVWGSEFGTLRGFVSDAQNGEKLSYVDVVLEKTAIGTYTDEKGYYYIPQIPPGEYTIVFSYLGYETIKKKIQVKAGDVLVLNIELIPTAIELPEIVVSAERERFEKSVEVSRITFTQREIKSVPSLFEADLLRIVQLMPGVTGMHDLSNKLYVRGGSPDENLVLLDGIIIYNPTAHLFGFFSTFPPDAVKEVELYTGGFPAKYGDRLSAMLNVTTREGNSKRYQGKVSIGLITSKILFEGPIPRGSILFSGRRTYFDAIAWAFGIKLPYYFYDGVGKINYNFSNDNRITLTGFGGADVLSFVEEGTTNNKITLFWSNQGISGRWRCIINPQLYSDILIVHSKFFTDLRHKDFYFSDNLNSNTAKADITYLLNESHSLEFGLHIEDLNAKQSWRLGDFARESTHQKSFLSAIYFQDKWQIIKPILYLQPGIRFLYYDQGDRFLYNPRLGLKYRFQENTAFNISGGKYNQFLITINSQESYFSIIDSWRPVDSLHFPPTSYHFVCGIEKWLGDETNFVIETYYKRYYNLLIPKGEDIFFTTPTESLDVGTGYAMGLDIYAKKTIKKTYGWISYSFGWTRRTINKESYFPRYDRRHNFNITIGTQLPSSIPILRDGNLSLRWFFGTGLPYSDDIGRYRYYFISDLEDLPYIPRIRWETIPSPRRDSHRLPVSHRLDLHYEKEMKIFGLSGSWYFDIINLYGQKNILFYSYEFYDEHGNPYEKPKKVGYSILPIPVPSFGIIVKF